MEIYAAFSKTTDDCFTEGTQIMCKQFMNAQLGCDLAAQK